MDFTERPALLVEVKSGQTYRGTYARHVRSVSALLSSQTRGMVVYGGEGLFVDGDVQVCGAREWATV